MDLLVVLGLFLAYVVGSIPTGYLFAKFFFKIDITEHGSGNIGASNVARVLGKRWFFLIFFLDALKAYAVMYYGVSVLCGGYVLDTTLPIVYSLAAATILGNAYSLFLCFKGGKGVATIAGIFAYLLPFELSIIALMLWLGIVGITHRPFIGSLVSVICVTSVYWGLYGGTHTLFLIFVCAWLVFRHLSNLKNWFSRVS